jgi:hypothetical protein
MEILYKISKISFLQCNNSLYILVSEENIFKISANQKFFFVQCQSETRIVHGDQVFLSNGDEMQKS